MNLIAAGKKEEDIIRHWETLKDTKII